MSGINGAMELTDSFWRLGVFVAPLFKDPQSGASPPFDWTPTDKLSFGDETWLTTSLGYYDHFNPHLNPTSLCADPKP